MVKLYYKEGINVVETNKEIISLTYDFMFKALFGNPKNIKILTRFLSDYFNIDYEVLEGKVKILNNELIKNNKLWSLKTSKRNDGKIEEILVKKATNKGIEQGINEGINKVVINMLKENIALDLISKYFGLEVHKIEEIKANLNWSHNN